MCLDIIYYKFNDLEKTRKDFHVFNQYIYANTASAGLLSSSLAQWRQQHDMDYLTSGSAMKTKAMQTETPETREKVADFFGCKTENVALVPNFSLGLNILIEGLNERHRILLLENDYPSVNWPFENRGFAISYVAIDEHLEAQIFDRIREEEITVFVLSLVQWTNGIRIDMEFLKLLKNEFPTLIIIADGTQFCGTTDFNFDNSPFDVLGSSGYKWLLSGYGNGFMLFKDDVKRHLLVKTIGFNAADANLNGRDSIRFSKHFEPGHLDTLNFGSLRFSLDYLKNLGMTNIEKKLGKLSGMARGEFTDLGLLEASVVSRKTHSTIFNIKGDDRLFEHLSNNSIMCSQRGNGIRLSFHFYNTEEDIESIVKVLKTGI